MKLQLICSRSVVTTPVVPRYEPTSQPGGLSVAHIPAPSADAFGAGLGEGIQRAASSASGIIQAARAEADRTATVSSRTAIDQTEVDLLYHPETGALNKRGREAFDVDRSTLQAYDERVAKIGGELATPEQKRTFDLMAAQRRVEINKQLQRHVAGEMKSYADAANKASLASTLNNVSTNYQDPERVEQERKFGLAVIMSDTDNKGLPPEVVKAKVDAWESSVQHAVIESMLNSGQATQAKAYFDKVQGGEKPALLPQDAEKLAAKMKPLVVKQEGMDTALKLAAGFNSATTTGELWRQRDEALGSARASLKDNPDALNLAETQIRQMASEREQGIKIAQGEAAAPIYAAMTKARQAGRIPSLGDFSNEDWARLQQTDPDKANDILKSIQAEVRVAQERAEAKQERREAKAERDERRAEADRLRQEQRNQRRNFADLWSAPEELGKADLNGMVAMGGLTPEQAKTLDERRRNDSMFTETQEVQRILGAAKIKPKSEQSDQVITYIEQRKAAFKTENGRAPKISEIADMAREALYKVDADWTPFDKPAYKMTLSDVPKVHREAITAERKRRGLPTTDNDIISTYARGQAKKAKGGK